MNKQNLYAFYGSLRNDQYNASYFKGGMKYKETTTVPGFKLFSLGPYPCVVRTDDDNDTIVVDLFELENNTAYRIHQMEKGAGYDYEEIEINGTKYGIYVYAPSSLERLRDRQVPGGDWVKFLQERNAEKV